jgi:hypothetical protein
LQPEAQKQQIGQITALLWLAEPLQSISGEPESGEYTFSEQYARACAHVMGSY